MDHHTGGGIGQPPHKYLFFALVCRSRTDAASRAHLRRYSDARSSEHEDAARVAGPLRRRAPPRRNMQDHDAAPETYCCLRSPIDPGSRTSPRCLRHRARCAHSAVEPTSGSPFRARLRSRRSRRDRHLRPLHAEVPSAPPADIPVAGQGDEGLLVAEEQTQEMDHLRLPALASHDRGQPASGECPARRRQSWFVRGPGGRLSPEDIPRPGARWRVLAIRDLRALDASGRTR
jgi:hypothetical protein